MKFIAENKKEEFDPTNKFSLNIWIGDEKKREK